MENVIRDRRKELGLSQEELAKRCGVSQSAISQQIAALESSMGVTLIERSGRGFRLTTAGDYFYRNGKQVLRSAEELCTRTAEL